MYVFADHGNFLSFQMCQKEKQDKLLTVPITAPVRRAAALTGVAPATISRVSRQVQKKMPRKQRRDKIVVDDFDRAVIRRTVHKMMASQKIQPTITTILSEVKENITYKGGREHLRKLLLEMGFKWKTVETNRKVLIENPDIVYKRVNYLRKLKEVREEGGPIVFMDETYIHTSHSPRKGWQTDGIAHTTPIGKGDRIIIVHAGSEDRFVKGAGLIFKSKSTSGDYHDDMNFTNYQKWIREKLIPNLPPKTTLIIDNAPYHNVQVDRCPTAATKKADIKAWLSRHGIEYPENFLKPELLNLCKIHKQPPKYVVDTILEEYGHKCLRLPPYHADFNPIEMIWANVKRKVGTRNFTFKMKDILELTEAAIDSVTAEDWRNCCRHVRTIEDRYWAEEIVIDRAIEPITFQVTSSDSGTDTASDSDEWSSGTDTADEIIDGK